MTFTKFLVHLLRYIEENYSKIRDVERELGNLTMEMKLTAGPKKAGMWVVFLLPLTIFIFIEFN